MGLGAFESSLSIGRVKVFSVVLLHCLQQAQEMEDCSKSNNGGGGGIEGSRNRWRHFRFSL